MQTVGAVLNPISSLGAAARSSLHNNARRLLPTGVRIISHVMLLEHYGSRESDERDACLMRLTVCAAVFRRKSLHTEEINNPTHFQTMTSIYIFSAQGVIL